jgi:hypothetical protein
MEIIYIKDFDCDGCNFNDVMDNISRHCHITPSDEIAIYGSPNYKYLICNNDSITFPKVVYVDMLHLLRDVTLVKVLPDIKKIRIFWPNSRDIDDFGKIQEINRFTGMSNFLDPSSRKFFNIKTRCKKLNDDMYRFTSKKGSWDIKINDYN